MMTAGIILSLYLLSVCITTALVNLCSCHSFSLLEAVHTATAVTLFPPLLISPAASLSIIRELSNTSSSASRPATLISSSLLTDEDRRSLSLRSMGMTHAYDTVLGMAASSLCRSVPSAIIEFDQIAAASGDLSFDDESTMSVVVAVH